MTQAIYYIITYKYCMILFAHKLNMNQCWCYIMKSIAGAHMLSDHKSKYWQTNKPTAGLLDEYHHHRHIGWNKMYCPLTGVTDKCTHLYHHIIKMKAWKRNIILNAFQFVDLVSFCPGCSFNFRFLIITTVFQF